jgi:Nucleotidyl transferase AbiEii toxin, Type IV TA system
MGTAGLAVRQGGVTAAGDGRPGLPAFQLEVARMFFALPASKGFLLAGGAALLAQHLTARPTEDLDFFTAPERGHVPAARDALEAGPASEAG